MHTWNLDFLSFQMSIDPIKVKYVKRKQNYSNINFNFSGHFKFFIAYHSIDNCIVFFSVQM